jgi:tetratricopeptide (TPR) repeat protein
MPRSPKDWFRKTSWSSNDEAEFRACLRRARRASRPQYLTLQAFHLIESGLPEPALDLLDEFFLAPDNIFLAEAHARRGQALTHLGRLEEAIAAYRSAIEASRRVRGGQGYWALDFAELILATRRADLFGEAIETLSTLPANNPFPMIEYREAAVRALIADSTGDRITARREAARALAAAAITKAPFVRHPRVGLVRGVDPTVHSKLEAMCAV